MVRVKHYIAVVLMFVSASSVQILSAEKESKKETGKVAGICFDRGDDWITVKADGEDEPVKYQVDRSDKKLYESFKSVFNACRVQLTYNSNCKS